MAAVGKGRGPARSSSRGLLPHQRAWSSCTHQKPCHGRFAIELSAASVLRAVLFQGERHLATFPNVDKGRGLGDITDENFFEYEVNNPWDKVFFPPQHSAYS